MTIDYRFVVVCFCEHTNSGTRTNTNTNTHTNLNSLGVHGRREELREHRGTEASHRVPTLHSRVAGVKATAIIVGARGDVGEGVGSVERVKPRVEESHGALACLQPLVVDEGDDAGPHRCRSRRTIHLRRPTVAVIVVVGRERRDVRDATALRDVLGVLDTACRLVGGDLILLPRRLGAVVALGRGEASARDGVAFNLVGGGDRRDPYTADRGDVRRRGGEVWHVG
mmetsp:Transcript_89407/g.255303  ORF Transcript_89407/g.255303 Transcript_89407/m.255303 type:complete len:226 (+) Transcript_89407:492-1169(+)